MKRQEANKNVSSQIFYIFLLASWDLKKASSSSFHFSPATTNFTWAYMSSTGL
jgi:hypothetical protein